MKLANANSVRSAYLARVLECLSDEDTGLIASNAINFPVVCEGEEGWVEVTVKVTKDGGDDGYLKREEYSHKVADAEAKAKAKAEAKAAKSKAKAKG